MKKFTKKMKGKKVLSLVLAAIMLATTFSFALPMLKLDASAVANIGGITQERVVGTDGSYATTYAKYAADFLNGSSNPTEIVVPGLKAAYQDNTTDLDYNDFVVQGLSYYAPKKWIIVSVYHNDNLLPSMLLAMDIVTGEFVKAFELQNQDGTENKDHGGGLAFSKYNFYYSGDDSDKDADDTVPGDADQIAYAPLEYFDNPRDTDGDGFCEVVLKGAVDLPEMRGTATAYVCFDEGVLWAGNFYEDGTGAGNYNSPALGSVIDKGNGVIYGNSMIYGYNLQGSSSEEEWAYLTGNKGNTSDCAGSPSYAIAVSTNIEDIQYAVVDNGRVYMSRSWGTGENDDWGGSNISGAIASLPKMSTLTIADIDLSVPGTESITYPDKNGVEKTIYAHYIADPDIAGSKTINHDLMPMSEGLCFIDGDLYLSFEGASNKYLNEYEFSVDFGNLASSVSKTGNCDYPIDVIWKVDTYKLLGAERPSEERSVYYERITRKSQIKDNEEYLIVYESAEKDPVTQKSILYAMDAFGGYKGNKITKSDSIASMRGYAGMVGYPITDYSIENGNLYLYDRDSDDIENIRWNISGANNGQLRIENRTAYFKGYSNFCFGDNMISMSSDGTDALTFEEAIVGEDYTDEFYLSCNGNYFWCNDGYEEPEKYTAEINNWYSSQTADMYAGLTETKGTFHANGLGSPLLGGDGVENFEHGRFQIYKRIVDPYASTAESRVYTDLNAELQEDGTYTVNLETYAVSPTQYQKVEKRPTDFIFVLDASSSMQSNTLDITSYKRWGVEKNGSTCTLSNKAITDENENATKDPGGKGIQYGFTSSSNPEYYKTSDGQYCQLYLAINTTKRSAFLGMLTEITQLYWAYYQNGDKYYIAGKDDEGYTWDQLYAKFEAEEDNTGKSEKTNNDTAGAGRYHDACYTGPHYTKEKITRLDYMKESVDAIIDKIAAECTGTIDHRIAVVQYGSTAGEQYYNTGLYKNDSTAMVQYNGTGSISASDYANVFYTADKFNTLKYRVIDYIESPTDKDADTYSNHGLEMAQGIIENSGYNYLTNGNRNVAIVMITDGVPGNSKDNAVEAHKTASLAIGEACKAKAKGATIYTAQIGDNSTSAFGAISMDRYLDYVSSEYIYAQHMTESGDKNPNGLIYHTDATMTDLTTFSNAMFSSIDASSTKGLATLDVNSVLREQLSNAFIVPDNYETDIKFAPGWYTKIGSYHFGEPSADIEGVDDVNVDTVTNSDGTKAIHITGYDYSAQCISVGKEQGNKLLVTLSGLLANPDANITNTSINDASKTAIYETEADLTANNGKGDPFKSFPTEYFTIPEYTYVLDYGFDMYDGDVNGTMLALDNGPNRQPRDANGNIVYSRDIESGMVEITNNSQDLIYRHNPAYADDSGFVLIQRDSGKYDWFEIKVVPASNVLYEETALNVTNPTDNNVYHWNKKGSPQITYQDLSTVADVYGYDSHLVSSTGFSNGTHYYTTVNKNNMFSDAATVTFKGNGFDLLSACGPNTGVQVVSLRKVNDDGTTSFVKGFIVDTYYDETSSQLLDANSLVHQVPIVKWEGKEYGTYTVETKAYYLAGGGAVKNHKTSSVKNNLIDTGLVMNTAELDSNAEIEKILEAEGWDKDKVELIWFDDNSVLNGGTGVAANKKAQRAKTNNDGIYLENYIDGFRVYNPLEDTSCYIEKERDAQYVNVLNNLANGSLEDATVDLASGNIAFVAGTPGENETLSFSNYEKFGPSDELYLKGGASQGVAFKTPVAPGGRVMISLRAVNGPATATINGQTFTVNSATEMYYDITETFTDAEIAARSALVSITNTGAGILSVNNIKLTNTLAAAGLMELSMDDLETVQYYADMEPVQATVKNGVVTPVVEEEENPGDNTGSDNDNTNDGTNTENGEKEEFSIFSLIELLIKLIEKILFNAFNNSKSI